jgi:hypothetical protein
LPVHSAGATDSSGAVTDSNADLTVIGLDCADEDVVYNVWDVAFESFRKLLVDHFTICAEQGNIRWVVKNNN